MVNGRWVLTYQLPNGEVRRRAAMIFPDDDKQEILDRMVAHYGQPVKIEWEKING